MGRYRIVSWHDVYVDDYEQGEIKHVNFFCLSGIYDAVNYQQAVEEHLNEHGYNLGMENCEVYKDTNSLLTSCLVDENNVQPNGYELEQWKKGKKVLYSDSMSIEVKELNEIIL